MIRIGFGGLANVMSLLFVCSVLLIGSLALPAQSGRHQPVDADSFVANSTSFAESKIHIILCIRGTCDFFGNGSQDCYCCPDGSRKEFCHQTLEECRAKCHACVPSCAPPPLSVKDGRN
ncbi:unnamed protein product [Urochloa humidicola]